MRPPEPIKAKGILLISPVSCVQAGELWSLCKRRPWAFSRGRATVPSCKVSQDIFLTTVCVQTTVFSLGGIPKTVPSSYTTDEAIKVQTTAGCAHVVRLLHQSWTCAGGQDLSLLRGWCNSPVPCEQTHEAGLFPRGRTPASKQKWSSVPLRGNGKKCQGTTVPYHSWVVPVLPAA